MAWISGFLAFLSNTFIASILPCMPSCNPPLDHHVAKEISLGFGIALHYLHFMIYIESHRRNNKLKFVMRYSILHLLYV